MADDYASYAQNLDSMISEQREHLTSGCQDLPFCLGPAAMLAFKAALVVDHRYAVRLAMVAVSELRMARDEIEAQRGMLRDASVALAAVDDAAAEKDAQIASLTAVVAELQQRLAAYEGEVDSPTYGGPS